MPSDEGEMRETPQKVHFSYVNDPRTWDTSDTLAFVCATNEDAKKAEVLFNLLLRERDEAREQKWISVNERAPDSQYDVLVTDGEFVALGDCCKGHLWNSQGVEVVTHWQPLPPPPAPRGE